MKSTTNRTPQKPSESGQAIIMFVLALGTFLLGAIGFATDFASLWFHQQRAQSAADAACQAGAMDMLSVADGTSTTTATGFTPGSTGFDCTSTSTTAPCKYAAINGYSGAGLVSNSESNKVSISFPSSINGATKPPSGIAGGYPFMEVDVVDRIRVYFSALLTGSLTQDVKVIAKCGLVLENSPIPILVLDPKSADTATFQVQGTPTVAIYGGPTRSIQDNTPNASAIQLGGTGAVDLSKGGPTYNGSVMGVVGGPYSLTSLLTGSTTFTPDSTAFYDPADTPISDPFAQLAAPTNTGMTTYSDPSKINALYHINGCPDPAGCYEYQPGYYPSGINAKNGTSIFDPGIYYVGGSGFNLLANSTVRPAILAGASAGSMFYLSGSTSTISVAANSGSKTYAKDGIDQFTTSYVTCPGETAQTVTDTSGNIVTALDGNILLGMCSGTYGDPLGENRGMLFFEDRSANLSKNQPSFLGGGTLLLAGNLYFHQCNSSGTGVNCLAADYTDQLALGGHAGSGTYVLGDIVTDQLLLGGKSGISMQLNPTSAYNVLKVELLQ